MGWGGHHLEPNMKSVLVYSREAFTTLYSKILAMFVTIREGSFDPDVSAVRRVEGQLHAQPVEVPDIPEQQPDQMDESDDSDTSMASEMCVEDFMVDEFSEETTIDCFPKIPSSSLFVHRVSGRYQRTLLSLGLSKETSLNWMAAVSASRSSKKGAPEIWPPLVKAAIDT